ncbi:hypothetical protein D3C81_1883260 [compost metagenome]
MAAEIGQVRRHCQLQAQFTIDLGLPEDFCGVWSPGQQQRIHICLGQLALGVEWQLPQQAPAAGQGQGFAVLAQVTSQGLRSVLAALGCAVRAGLAR